MFSVQMLVLAAIPITLSDIYFTLSFFVCVGVCQIDTVLVTLTSPHCDLFRAHIFYAFQWHCMPVTVWRFASGSAAGKGGKRDKSVKPSVSKAKSSGNFSMTSLWLRVKAILISLQHPHHSHVCRSERISDVSLTSCCSIMVSMLTSKCYI